MPFLAPALVFLLFFLYVALSAVFFARRYENWPRKIVFVAIFVVVALPALWLGVLHAGLVVSP
jgi:hypothetical protein